MRLPRLDHARTCGAIVTLIITTVLLGAGCATSEEWTTWRQHPTHFVSAGHLGF